MTQETTAAVFSRYRELPMLGVEAWRAFLDGDDAALPGLTARPKNVNAPWLWEDLARLLPAPDALGDVHRRILRGLGAVRTTANVASWLGHHLAAEPSDGRLFEEVADVMELSPEFRLQLALSTRHATLGHDSAGRAILAAEDASMVPRLVIDDVLQKRILAFLGSHAPERLDAIAAEVARAPHRPSMTPFAMAMIEAGVGGPTVEAAVARSGRLAVLAERAGLSGVPAFEQRLRAAIGDVVKYGRLTPEQVGPLADFALDGVGSAVEVARALSGDARSASEGPDGGPFVPADADTVAAVIAELVPLVSLPPAFGDDGRRFFRAVVAAGQTAALASAIKTWVSAERSGEDAFGAITHELQAAGVDPAALEALVERCDAAVANKTVATSFGRALLARTDDALSAFASRHVAVLAEIARVDPARAARLLPAVLAVRGAATALVSLLVRLLAIDSRFTPTVLELARDPSVLFSEAERTRGRGPGDVGNARLHLYRALVRLDRATFGAEAKDAVVAVASAMTTATVPAFRWLLRTFASDVRRELEAVVSAAPAYMADDLAMELLMTFGAASQVAVDYFLQHTDARTRDVARARLAELCPEPEGLGPPHGAKMS